MRKWYSPIERMGACQEAIDYCKQFDTLDEAWAKCERGEWMLWLIGKRVDEPETDSRRKLVSTACQCARLALPYVKEGETRPLKAIETAEAWARQEKGVSLVDVRSAADAAYAVAADAAHAAAYAADAAAYAVAAAYAADAAAYAAKKQKVLKQCADIVKNHYTTDEITTMLKGGNK